MGTKKSDEKPLLNGGLSVWSAASRTWLSKLRHGWKESLSRWRQLLAVAFSAATLASCTVPLWSIHIPPAAASVDVIFAVAVFCITALLYVLFGSPNPQARWHRAINHAGHALSYPPAWIGGFIASAIYLLEVAWISWPPSPIRYDLVAERETLTALGIFTLATVVVYIAVGSSVHVLAEVSRRRAAAADSQQTIPKTSSILSDYASLYAWIVDDSPVTDVRHDILGSYPVARRVVARIRSGHSQVIVGQIGSGKSTIRALVESQLRSEERQFRVVSVSLWPYGNVNTALRGIVQHTIDCLGDDVDVLGLYSVPNAYARAVGAFGAPWSALGLAVEPAPSPSAALERIANVARAAGVHLVVWIEDLERLAVDPETEDARTALPAIQSLLHGLSAAGDSISVVLATTAAHRELDFTKIAHYVDFVPKIGEREVIKCISLVLNSMSVGRPELEETELVKSVRQILSVYETVENGAWALRAPTSSELSAVADICGTPRVLKHALRSWVADWSDALMHELDAGDLLLMTVVRESFPAVVGQIDRDVETWRADGMLMRFLRDDERKAETDAAMERALDHVYPQQREPVRTLLNHVFHGPSKPQGLRHRFDADYWRRFVSRGGIKSELTDESILLSLKSDSELEIARMIVGNLSAVRRIQMLSGVVPAGRWISILRCAVDLCINEPTDTFRSAVATIGISMADNQDLKWSDVVDSVKALVVYLLERKSVSGVHSLMRVFVNMDAVAGNATQDERALLSHFIRCRVIDHFTNHTSDFSTAFAGHPPYLLNELLGTADFDELSKLPNWRPFAEMLLLCIVDGSMPGILQVGPLVTEYLDIFQHGKSAMTVGYLDVRSADALFSSIDAPGSDRLVAAVADSLRKVEVPEDHPRGLDVTIEAFRVSRVHGTPPRRFRR